MKRFIVAFLLLACSAPFAGAQEAPRFETVRYTLDNGLQVVLSPDRRVPKVVMNLRYRVGSMNEPAGRSGFAHLFEHLMFSGTPAWPSVFGAQAAMGNSINAWTQEDGTVYYVEGLSANLPSVLSIEADRMANLGDDVDQRELDLQRNVVKNEMRQNVLDSAGAAGWNAFWSGLFPKSHPYSRAVIGSIADIDEATLGDVKGFFNTYYVPNNAVLVLVGDFDVEDAKALVRDTFGRVPKRADVPRPQAGDPAPTKFRLEVTDRVATPSVSIGWSGPVVTTPRSGDLDIASDLLGNGAYGFLREKLVTEKGVANSVSASWSGGLLGGRFEIDATANEGVSAETLEKELRTAYQEFLMKPIDPADVARAKSSALLRASIAIEPLSDRTSAIAASADLLDDPDYVLKDDPQLVNATADSVSEAVRSLFPIADSSTLVVRPGARGDYPRILLDTSGTPKPFDIAARPRIEIPKLPAREPGTAPLPEKTTATLANGIKVVHYQLPDSPMDYLSAVSTGGWPNAPEGKEGLIDVATNMSIRGAGKFTYSEFAKAAADIGASIGYSSGNVGTAIALSAPKAEFDAGLGLLGDVILRPRFDEDQWKLAMLDYGQFLANRDSDLPGVTSRAGENILFPKQPGKPDEDWSIEALKAMTLDDAKAAFRKLYQPNNTTFYSVGSRPIGEVVASLEKVFGEWKNDQPGFIADPVTSPVFGSGRQVILVPEPGASQSALYIATPAPGRDDPNRAEATAVMRLFGDDFSGRLNSVIREEKGYTYGTSARLMSGMARNAGMTVEMTVERDNTGAALQEVFKGFEGLKTKAVSQEELDRTVTAYRTAIASTAETGRGFAGYVVDVATLGLTIEQDFARRQNVSDLKLDSVSKMAPAMSSLTPSLIVIGGDPDVVLPQLTAIGLTDVKIIERKDMPEPATRGVGDALSGEEEPAPSGPPSAGVGSTPGMGVCPPGQVCMPQKVD